MQNVDFRFLPRFSDAVETFDPFFHVPFQHCSDCERSQISLESQAEAGEAGRLQAGYRLPWAVISSDVSAEWKQRFGDA